MNESVVLSNEDREVMDMSVYADDITPFFRNVSNLARPLYQGAKAAFDNIEQMLRSAPALIQTAKAMIPEETLQAVLTNKQKSKLASGSLKLMTKKDGSLMANLIDPKTKKILSTIPLKKVKISPELSQAMASYATQMQMAQIVKEIQQVQVAIEEIRQGLENDRLATAYSCQQKLIQAMAMKNPELKAMALLRLVSDAEDSRNLLMQSQNVHNDFIKKQPESMWRKLLSGSTTEKIQARMAELRDGLAAINLVSLAEAMAYQEMGETESAQLSLQYYADYIQKAYLDDENFVQRLDMIDSSTELHWSKTLSEIKQRIQALPYNANSLQLGESNDETESL